MLMPALEICKHWQSFSDVIPQILPDMDMHGPKEGAMDTTIGILKIDHLYGFSE